MNVANKEDSDVIESSMEDLNLIESSKQDLNVIENRATSRPQHACIMHTKVTFLNMIEHKRIGALLA
jgi:hypothetical protein